MKRELVVFLSLALLAVAALRAEDVHRISNWTAPPYWTPEARDGTAADGGAAGTLATLVMTAASPLPFVAVAPCRIVDTRFSNGAYGSPGLSASVSREFSLPGGPCPGIPPNAGAYSLNVTVIASPGVYQNAFLTVWPTGSAQPVVSTLNFNGGQVVANAAVVPAGTAGSITVIAAAAANLIIDINGYYAQVPAVSSLNALTGDVVLSPGSNVSIVPSGNTLTLNASGTITGVSANTGLSGGGTSGNVGLEVAVPLSLTGTVAQAIVGGTNNGAGPGLQGVSAGGAGVGGVGGATGTTYGVLGSSSSSSGFGVLGTGNMGVSGFTGSPSSNYSYAYVGGAGVWGSSAASVGVYGTSDSNQGVAGRSYDGSGVLGIGTNGNGVKGQSTYGRGVEGSSTYSFGLYCVGNGQYTGTWSGISDARLKKDIHPLEGALERVLALKGVSFRWRVAEFPERNLADGKQVGFVAQEVEPVVPEVVVTDREGWKAVDYGKLTPLLVEAIKAQQAEIDFLKAEVEELRRSSKP